MNSPYRDLAPVQESPVSPNAGRRRTFAVALALVGTFHGLPTADAQTVNAVYQFGTPGRDVGLGVASDSSGIYVCGSTRGTLPGETKLGRDDAFVEKFDSAGTSLWTIQFGSRQHDYALGCSANATGLYVVGETDGVFPGTKNHGLADTFVQKITFGGRLQWARELGSPQIDSAYSVTTRPKSIALAGLTAGSLPGQHSNGFADAFVAAFSARGRRVWIHQFGTGHVDYATGTATQSGLYVVGTTSGNLSGKVGSSDAFLRKYTWAGPEVWTRQFGSRSSDYAWGIATDTTGLYVVGDTYGTLPHQTSLGFADGFVRKYTGGGRRLWTHQFGSADSDSATGIASDGSNVYAVGHEAVAGNFDVAVWRYSPDGANPGSLVFGTTRNDYGTGVAVTDGNAWVVGSTHGTMPDQTHFGGWDAFFADVT